MNRLQIPPRVVPRCEISRSADCEYCSLEVGRSSIELGSVEADCRGYSCGYENNVTCSQNIVSQVFNFHVASTREMVKVPVVAQIAFATLAESVAVGNGCPHWKRTHIRLSRTRSSPCECAL